MPLYSLSLSLLALIVLKYSEKAPHRVFKTQDGKKDWL